MWNVCEFDNVWCRLSRFTTTPLKGIFWKPMTCVGHYEIKPLIHKKFIEKNKYIHTNGMLENGLVYLYHAFQFNVINDSNTSTNYKSLTNQAFSMCKIPFTFQWESHWLFFSSIACNSTIVWNEQTQEHNNFVTIQRAQLKEAYESSKGLQFVKTLNSRNMKWMKPTHLSSITISKP